MYYFTHFIGFDSYFSSNILITRFKKASESILENMYRNYYDVKTVTDSQKPFALVSKGKNVNV